ncbi:hypothetical protein Mapa_002566 [Marchantia paleacea]|nr:hypothetical protein Mapa_002566 [Marchantia paleacea]
MRLNQEIKNTKQASNILDKVEKILIKKPGLPSDNTTPFTLQNATGTQHLLLRQ